MKKLAPQLIVLTVVSLVLGIANNFRPSAKIQWVRDWPAFSAIAYQEEMAPTPSEENSSEETTAQQPQLDPAVREAEVSEMIATNDGITDIGLDKAFDIFTYAKDLTFWIDARNPDLFAEGHIQGAHLLDLYEKNTYLNEIQSLISEQNPIALIVYCKGKECTDSHHLAQDLQMLGYPNIFVYKDGFDDWYSAGYPIDGDLASGMDAAPDAEEQPAVDEQSVAEIMEMVATNAGITDIDLDQAHLVYAHAADLTYWIDARSIDLYNEGHIKGADHLDLYEKNTYLPQVQERISQADPLALVIYCKGKDCTDSHHLAQDMQALGYTNIFVYKNGFDDWYEAGFEIEGELAGTAPPTFRTRDSLKEKPPGMYLEHVVRDIVPFLVGMLLLVSWKRTADKKGWVIAASIFVGLFFVWAALPKIQNPLLFAKNIWNYDIAPGSIINITALLMPAFELVCGAGLIFGFMRRGSGFFVSAMLVIFIIAVSFNVLRGHEFNCGCTSTTTMFTETYLTGWNDKLTLILRDVGLLVMSLMALRFKQTSKS